jgi:hypothetical protein
MQRRDKEDKDGQPERGKDKKDEERQSNAKGFKMTNNNIQDLQELSIFLIKLGRKKDAQV